MQVSTEIEVGQIKVQSDFKVNIKEKNGAFECHIPTYDFYFSSPGTEGLPEIKKKAQAMVRAYYRHLFDFKL